MANRFIEMCLYVFGNQAYNVIGWFIACVCIALIGVCIATLTMILKGE